MNNFWDWVSQSIIKFKVVILIVVLTISIALGFIASKIQLSYELAKILPKTDERFQLYESFKKKYGEDGSIMVIGLENPQLFNPKEFDAWRNLSESIKQKEGIKSTISVDNIPEIYLDTLDKKFKSKPIFNKEKVASQGNLDSLKTKLSRLPVYSGLLYTPDLKVHLMLISLDQKTINNKNRIKLVREIKQLGDQYALKMGHEVHYSGMPFIRTELTAQVTNELFIFLGLAILVTSFILFYFFRSYKVVFFALIIIII
jgi:hypothetical protein